MATALVETLCGLLRRHYVFADRVEAMCSALAAPPLGDLAGPELAAAMTDRLQSISPDRHLRVRWFAQAPVEKGNDDDDEARRQRRIEARIDHQGLQRIERLAGQVGLLAISEFHPVVDATPALAAAMTVLEASRALIIDLRGCRGGEPDTVALLCSHLLGAQPVHLNDLYLRAENRTQSFWTRPDAAQPRLPDVPLFALCSRDTFSAGEEFAYDLQVLGRATVVGEVSRGGANPGRVHRLDDHFAIFIPDARAINPLTGDNWEGRGVQPDVACAAPQALAVAHRLALQAVLAGLDQNDAALDGLFEEIRAALAEPTH